MIAESEPCKFAFTLTSLPAYPIRALLSYWVAIRSNVPYKYSMSRRRWVSSHFLGKFFLPFVYGLYADVESAALRGKPIGKPRLLPSSSSLPSALLSPSGDKSDRENGQRQSDTYRPYTLHDLVIAVKMSCCCFCIATHHGWLAEREPGRRKTSAEPRWEKLTERKRNFLFPPPFPTLSRRAVSKREEIITCIRSTNIRRSRVVRAGAKTWRHGVLCEAGGTKFLAYSRRNLAKKNREKAESDEANRNC